MMTFPPASLQAQLDELRRERIRRDHDYPLLIARRALQAEVAAHNNRGLDGAIVTLERLVEAQQRGEPGRKELIGVLRESLLYLPTGMGPAVALHARIIDMLSRVPE